jgi:hypothetical protein
LYGAGAGATADVLGFDPSTLGAVDKDALGALDAAAVGSFDKDQVGTLDAVDLEKNKWPV